MASKSSDSCSNGSIAAQRDEIARQLVEAVVQCQDAPAVARQQVEIQSEIEFIGAILGPIIEENRQWGERLETVAAWEKEDTRDNDMLRSYISFWFSEEQYQRFEKGLERPLERGAAFAEETKNRALAKAVRHVRAALAAMKEAWGRHDDQEFRQAQTESRLLLSKVEDRLRRLRAQADVRLARAPARAAEIDAWKKQQADLQEAAHALAAVRRIPNAPEDEDDR